MKTIAQATMPGPAHARPTVPTTQATVVIARSDFFPAWASAQAPSTGPATITSAYETDRPAVHANVAHATFCATTETKYALNTAVSTTVVYPELAKSYIAHAQTSRRLTPGLRAP